MNANVDAAGTSSGQRGGRSGDTRRDRRIVPSLWQHDYLVLRFLARDIRRSLSLVGRASQGSVALDVGAADGPYAAWLRDAGFRVQSIDIAPGPGIDVIGTAEDTGLRDASVDLVLCTQVLEHTRAPWRAMHEFARILRPGGVVVLSVPHVWFFHPHPSDYWRMTSEGVKALCDEGGFEVLRVDAQGTSAAALFQVVNFLAFGALGRLGAPVYAAMNLLGLAANAIVRDDRFALNHSCVARRRETAR